MPPRQGMNPATKQVLHFPVEGKAIYVEDGRKTGNISLEDGELLTGNVPLAVCEKIANELGAVVSEDDRS